MNLPPVADLLRQHHIGYVSNNINGKFNSNCPACKRPTTNFVELDDDGGGFRCHCEECGFSGAARLRSARAKPDGNAFGEAQREFAEEPEPELEPESEPASGGGQERDDGSGGDSDGGGGEPPPRLITVAPSDRDRQPLAGGAS